MKNKTLSLFKSDNAHYISVFRNNHGRVIYLSIVRSGESVEIAECEYLDRTKAASPKRLVTRTCELAQITDVIGAELDKSFSKVEFCDDVTVSKDYLVSIFLGSRKIKVLILIAEGDRLMTIFKSKFRREIYLELALNDGVATLVKCYYVDKRAKGMKLPPQGIITVRFDYSLEKLLEVINLELEGGFTHVLVTREHTLTLNDGPICGSI